jgi:peptidyl-prolyl cis-trans isomerase SurA
MAISPFRLLAAVSLAASVMCTAPALAARSVPLTAAQPEVIRIVAVVNGHPITNEDVDNRARLFAVASALPVSPDTLERLKPQITRQLIDERLRMQEIEKEHIVVPTQALVDDIKQLEARNGLPPGGLRAKLQADGMSFTTLIDQLRTQVGWTQVLRRKLGDRGVVTDADIAEQRRLLAQQVGQPEYHVAEIFIPAEGSNGNAVATRFSDTVIKELRAGAPFAVVAAQFSQSQSALQGGDLGWVQPNQLDPPVARVVAEMPAGAVSNPIPVLGGDDIVTLIAKRTVGNQVATVLSMRQVFLPFAGPLNPNTPTAAQVQLLQKAKDIAATTRSCGQMEQIAQEVKSPRPADPGEVQLDDVNPPSFRDMLAKMPLETASKPLVSPDGIAVMMVCSREERNLAQMSAKDIKQQIFIQRVELLSRQLLQDLRNQARIEIRSNAGAA